MFTLTFTAGVFYWFWVSEKHIYWFIAICCLSVWHAACDTWHSFTSHRDVARRCDPSRCCKSIWCAQTHCPVPMGTSPRCRISARPAAFCTAMCHVTERGCVYYYLCICAFDTELLKPLPGPSPTCIMSVGKLCGTAYAHMASALANPVFGHYCCLATSELGYYGCKITTDGDLYTTVGAVPWYGWGWVGVVVGVGEWGYWGLGSWCWGLGAWAWELGGWSWGWECLWHYSTWMISTCDPGGQFE